MSGGRHELRLTYAKILVELGELDEAEREVAEVLDAAPDDLTGLNLFAKIKHMKGELSQAVACWAQLHARAPHNELALMSLGSLLQLAKDPERNAGDFLALGQFQLARKPVAHMELESAFRLFIARRPEEAVAAADRLATKYRSSDRELFKLCVIAKAWFLELSGDHDRASVVLEELGRERGFETDTDRVLGLARLYERIGTPEKLEKAIHIFQFLERTFMKLSAASRLAALYRKLGNEAVAAEYERKYAQAFRRRMHRPTRGEACEVAAALYVPLSALRTIAPGLGDDERKMEGRAKWVEEALFGDREAAREGFRAVGEPLDRKYLADLAAEDGRTDEAVGLYLGALDARAVDMRAVHSLLALRPKTSSPTLFAPLAHSELGTAVAEALTTSIKVSPRKVSAWRDLSALRYVEGRAAEAARAEQRAQALSDAARRDGEPVGRVLAAAVYHFVGKAKGLVHEIWVDRRPVSMGRGGFLHGDDVLGNVTPDMRQGVRNTFFAVREYVRSRFPHRAGDILDYDYTYKVTKEDEPSGGLSAGLPTALGFLSVFLQAPVPQDLASTGVVIADAHDVLLVRHVAEVEFKVKAACNRNLRRLLLPRDNRAEVEANPTLPRAATSELVHYVATLDEAVSTVWGADIWTQ